MQVLSKVTDCHISFFSVSICQELSLSLSTVREFMIPKKLTNRAIVLVSRNKLNAAFIGMPSLLDLVQ